MASSPTKDAPLQTTRQLLDELDALMERMLALPIEDQDTDLSQPAPAASAPTVAATLTMVNPPPEPAPAPERLRLLPPPASAPSFAMEIASRIASPEPVEDEAPSSETDEAHYITTLADRPAPSLEDVAAPVMETLTPLPPKVHARPSMGYQFLVWVNRRYDRSVVRFGRTGRVLRSGVFRMLLGLAGLGMILTALGWLTRDWLDWKQ